jgi:hypothetical protein
MRQGGASAGKGDDLKPVPAPTLANFCCEKAAGGFVKLGYDPPDHGGFSDTGPAGQQNRRMHQDFPLVNT